MSRVRSPSPAPCFQQLTAIWLNGLLRYAPVSPQAAFEALITRWAGILVSDGYVVYGQWVHARQTCLAHLIRRARGLSERQDPELADFGRRVLAERQRLVHWATAPPT